MEDWKGVELEVVLDSGCSKNVMPADCAPGYRVRQTPESRLGHNFIVGNGERVPNLYGCQEEFRCSGRMVLLFSALFCGALTSACSGGASLWCI